MTATATIATVNAAAAIDELDEVQILADAAEEDGYDGPTPDDKPAKRGRADKGPSEKEMKVEAARAERERVQALVPWTISEPQGWQIEQGQVFGSNQKGEISQYFDDHGKHPTRFRAYSREEWVQAIAALADVVHGLIEAAPDYQRRTGLYVEEQADDLLLIRGKEWVLQILVPAKGSLKGKTFELKAAPGKDSWGMDDKRADGLAELLATYVPADARDTLLDICCQYLRSVRIRVNRSIWITEHPDLADLANADR